MVDLIHPVVVGKVKIDHYEVSKSEAIMSSFRPGQACRPGKYARLLINGRLYMSDTDMEHRTNYGILLHGHGRVLIAGLGIGMVLVPLLLNPEVTSVTVVELSQDVIDAIVPQLRDAEQLREVIHKLNVVQGDIYEWTAPKGEKYDVIYFDIWADQSTDDLKDMERLHRRFAARLNRTNPNRWMQSWRRDELLATKRQEKRRGGWW